MLTLRSILDYQRYSLLLYLLPELRKEILALVFKSAIVVYHPQKYRCAVRGRAVLLLTCRQSRTEALHLIHRCYTFTLEEETSPRRVLENPGKHKRAELTAMEPDVVSYDDIYIDMLKSKIRGWFATDWGDVDYSQARFPNLRSAVLARRATYSPSHSTENAENRRSKAR